MRRKPEPISPEVAENAAKTARLSAQRGLIVVVAAIMLLLIQYSHPTALWPPIALVVVLLVPVLSDYSAWRMLVQREGYERKRASRSE